MTGTASNVIAGMASLWLAPANTAAPAESTTVGSAAFVAPTGPWVGIGFSESGLDLTVEDKVNEIRVEEQSTPVLVVKDTSDVTVDFTFAEDTIANMVYAYGGGTVTTTAASGTVPGSTQLALSDTLATVALWATGANPAGFVRGIYIPQMVSHGKVKTSYRRAKGPRLYPTTFTAICALSSITITDLTAVVT